MVLRKLWAQRGKGGRVEVASSKPRSMSADMCELGWWMTHVERSFASRNARSAAGSMFKRLELSQDCFLMMLERTAVER